MQYKQRNPLSIRCNQQEIDLTGIIAATRGAPRHQVLVEAFRLGLAIVADRHGFTLPADTSPSDTSKPE